MALNDQMSSIYLSKEDPLQINCTNSPLLEIETVHELNHSLLPLFAKYDKFGYCIIGVLSNIYRSLWIITVK